MIRSRRQTRKVRSVPALDSNPEGLSRREATRHDQHSEVKLFGYGEKESGRL